VYSILFVCMGNICRSPTAHGVFRKMVAEQGLTHLVQIDSAGTENFHPRSPPDKRAQVHAAKRGYDLSDLRARQVSAHDFERHDLILAMDPDNLARLRSSCPPEHWHKLRRFTEFCLSRQAELVPDPYYSDAQGFENVLDLVEDACLGLLQHVRQTSRIEP
jgi:protein-tyrosine phosphatase